MKISVVIATLGGKQLLKTIKSLEFSYFQPNEIICVFAKHKFKPIFSKKINIKNIYSNNANQVLQRIEGLKHAKNHIILQADDDIIFEKYSLMHLVNAFLKKNSYKTLLGPVFVNKKNRIHFNYNEKNIISEIIKLIFCAAPLGSKKLGKITNLGIAYGINYKKKKNLFQSEWLPGGCILYHKNNKILKFPYKFKDKSYCEDLIHSLLRKKYNLNHFIVRKSKVYAPPIDYSNYSLFDILAEFKVRKYLLSYLNGNKIRYFIWCIFEIFNRFFKSVIR